MTDSTTSTQNHLYLVDGSGYIFRAYHRMPPLTNTEGTPVGAVYGYTTMLWKLINDLHQPNGPTHMAVILDAPGPSFRKDIYEAYKAHRPPAPEDLVPQFPLIRTATRAFSVPCIEMSGFEADDLIASYARAALAEGWKVTIVSSDKDLMQLIEPQLDMLDTMNNRWLERAAVIDKFGVPPELLGDVLGLMGDAVDNVPGVPGVGPKTAAKLVQDHGSLEAALAAAPTMKPSKLRDNLIEHAEQARLSRVLVTLKEDVPLPEPLDSFLLNKIPPAPLREFLTAQGFRSLLNKVVDEGSTPAPKGAPSAERAPAPTATTYAAETFDLDAYECVQTRDQLKGWVAEAHRTGLCAIDTETDALNALSAQWVGFSLATAPGRACYVPLKHGGTDLLSETPQQISMADAIAVLKPLLADPSVLKIGHNLKYDLNVMERHGLIITPYADTLVMSFNLDAGKHNHNMDDLAALHFQHKTISFSEVCGKGKNQLSFNQVPLRDATRYAAEDADVTLRLYHRLRPRLATEQVTRVYEHVDRGMVQVLADMEREGILVDREALARLSAEFAVQIEALEGQIFALSGSPFTIGSPKQLGEILFDKMGLKGGRKGKSGEYSTDVTELERLAAQGIMIAEKVLEWRQLSKLKSTYTDALQAQINPNTGRVHTSYALTGAQTGRLSSNDPNLMNIPVRTEIGRQIRDAFVAPPERVLLSADYSQIELRLAAHIADVPALKQAFANDEDIHSITAQELFGEVNRDTRGKAKTINFSLLYGISRWGLAQRLSITPPEAQAMIDRYYERFPGIARYISETLEGAREAGFTTTLFGRKTHFARIKSSNAIERQGSERAAMNAPIQGSAADLIKRAMIQMRPALNKAGLDDVKMLLQVHDELVFEVPEAQVEAASRVIAHVMEHAAEPFLNMDVPLKVEIGTGKSWGAAH